MLRYFTNKLREIARIAFVRFSVHPVTAKKCLEQLATAKEGSGATSGWK